MAIQTGEWWKKPAPKPWYQQPIAKPKQWYQSVPKPAAKPAARSNDYVPESVDLGNYADNYTTNGGANYTNRDTGASYAGGGGYAADPAAIAAAIQKAQDDARRGQLKGKANAYLDQLVGLYDQVLGLIKTTGADNTTRINKNYDGKVGQQLDLMNEGMYQTDAANAANNLGSSSWKAFDRGKVRKVKDTNVQTLEDSRSGDLATIGKMVSEDTAKYTADKNGIGNTRELLGQTTDLGELTSTVNNLDGTVRGTQAAMGKYGTQGEFVQKANSLGNYDTSNLEKNMATIVANASASPAAKQAAVDDLLNGTPLDQKKKDELKSKYVQVI
jgi:hypothetical protein